MRIEGHDKLGNPIKVDLTRLVIYDDFDNPVAVAVKYSHGFLYVGHIRDPEFQDYLHLLGIDKTVIVNTIDTNKLQTLKLK